MRRLISFSLLVLISSFVLGQATNEGFTDRAEAKNLMVNGMKDGKWVEYIDSVYQPTTNPNAAHYYLSVYKAGKHEGMARQYDKGGILVMTVPYRNDTANGIVKMYYKSGKIADETPYVNNSREGLEKTYYESGKIQKETPYSHNKINGISKGYFEDGKIKSEVTFVDDVVKLTKMYDESGKETQQ